MFLFRFAKLLSFFFCVRILGKLLASNLLPLISIVFPNKIVKSLFNIFSENVLIDIFLRFENLPFRNLRSLITIELLPSLKFIYLNLRLSLNFSNSKETSAIFFLVLDNL